MNSLNVTDFFDVDNVKNEIEQRRQQKRGLDSLGLDLVLTLNLKKKPLFFSEDDKLKMLDSINNGGDIEESLLELLLSNNQKKDFEEKRTKEELGIINKNDSYNKVRKILHEAIGNIYDVKNLRDVLSSVLSEYIMDYHLLLLQDEFKDFWKSIEIDDVDLKGFGGQSISYDAYLRLSKEEKEKYIYEYKKDDDTIGYYERREIEFLNKSIEDILKDRGVDVTRGMIESHGLDAFKDSLIDRIVDALKSHRKKRLEKGIPRKPKNDSDDDQPPFKNNPSRFLPPIPPKRSRTRIQKRM